VQQLVEQDGTALSTALTGGDDYELVFAVPSEHRDALLDLARAIELPLTRIGQLVAGHEVTIRSPNGGVLDTGQAGWQHF
jgi:thiamine-monophosphate kinase